jgi:hypothetical protein
MVSVLVSSAVDRGFEPRSTQTKDYEIGICCFSTKNAAWRRKNTDCLVRNQNNVSEWSDMAIRGLLFQWASTIKIQLSVVFWYKANLTIISLNIYLFSPWYSLKIAELALNNNHSLSPEQIACFGFVRKIINERRRRRKDLIWSKIPPRKLYGSHFENIIELKKFSISSFKWMKKFRHTSTNSNKYSRKFVKLKL